MEKLKESNRKLTAQINCDFENSSIHPPCRSRREKRFQTHAKKQDAGLEASRGIKDTATENMCRQKPMNSLCIMRLER